MRPLLLEILILPPRNCFPFGRAGVASLLLIERRPDVDQMVAADSDATDEPET